MHDAVAASQLTAWGHLAHACTASSTSASHATSPPPPTTTTKQHSDVDIPACLPLLQVQGDKEFGRKMEEFAMQQQLEVQKKREVRTVERTGGAH